MHHSGPAFPLTCSKVSFQPQVQSQQVLFPSQGVCRELAVGLLCPLLSPLPRDLVSMVQGILGAPGVEEMRGVLRSLCRFLGPKLMILNSVISM